MPKSPTSPAKRIKTRTRNDRKTRKITGSRAAVKGFDFEELVALVSILKAEYDRKAKDPRLYHFCAYDDAFVDDLVIDAPGAPRRWIQIRAREKAVWPKELKDDFDEQRMDNPNDDFVLMVDSLGKRELLKSDPRRLVFVHPDYVDIEWMNAPFLEKPIVTMLEHLTKDRWHLQQSATMWAWVQSAWRQVGRRGTLEQILSIASSNSEGAIRSGVPCSMEQSRLLELLSKMDGARFTGDREYIEYARLTSSGHRVKYRGRILWQDFLDAFEDVPKTWDAFDDGLDALGRK
jgi:hypothetical protein